MASNMKLMKPLRWRDMRKPLVIVGGVKEETHLLVELATAQEVCDQMALRPIRAKPFSRDLEICHVSVVVPSRPHITSLADLLFQPHANRARPVLRRLAENTDHPRDSMDQQTRRESRDRTSRLTPTGLKHLDKFRTSGPMGRALSQGWSGGVAT